MMFLLGVLGCFAAVSAFAVILETPRKYVLHDGIVGGIGGFVYLFSIEKGLDVVMASFLSALAIALMSHTFARIFKAPVTIFLIAGILPTVPGAGMYRIVYYLIANDNARSNYYLIQTLEVAGVIALAIFITDTLFKVRIKKENPKEKP